MEPAMNRKAIAIVVIALCVGGLGWLIRRNYSGDVNRRLTEAAIRIEPGTFYYEVFYRGTKIGSAASSIDTLPATIATDDYYTGAYPFGDSLVNVNGRVRARLTRALRMSYLTLDFTRAGHNSKMGAFVDGDSVLVVTHGSNNDSPASRTPLEKSLIAPSLLGIALVLAEPPKIGRMENFVVFDPITGKAEPRSVRIAAESVFTVPDSAAQDARGEWAIAHSDTVRAWRIGGDVSGLRVWVDAQGRIVNGSTANGVALSRTAFEIAFPRGAAQKK